MPAVPVSIDLTLRGDEITVTGFREPSFEGLVIDIDEAPAERSAELLIEVCRVLRRNR